MSLSTKDPEGEGGFMKGKERYERRLKRVYETIEFGAGRVLKKIFVLDSAGCENGRWSWAGKCFYQFE